MADVSARLEELEIDTNLMEQKKRAQKSAAEKKELMMEDLLNMVRANPSLEGKRMAERNDEEDERRFEAWLAAEEQSHDGHPGAHGRQAGAVVGGEL